MSDNGLLSDERLAAELAAIPFAVPRNALEQHITALGYEIEGKDASIAHLDKQVDTMRRELQGLRQGWQPIETAPAGETVVLWMLGATSWGNSGPIIARKMRHPSSGDSYWFEQIRGRHTFMSGDAKFTHWMPLPPPPATPGGQ